MENTFAEFTLDYENSMMLLHKLLESKTDGYTLLIDRKQLRFEQEGKPMFTFYFPWLFYPNYSEDVESYPQLESFPKPDYLLLLIQAGSAALAYFEEGTLDSHKVIRKYMVRAKQGKAQIKHLKTKGKSRLGSRIRLSQTQQFFEEINEKLVEWEIEHIDQILYSASIDIWNLLFEAKTLPPFEKRDDKLFKIPLDISSPNLEVLLKVNEQAQQGKIVIQGSLEPWEEILKDLP